MGSDVIHVSKESLKAVLLAYDSIADADNGLKACQCSTFRSMVSLRHEAAQEAYAEVRKAISKSPKRGLLISIGAAKQILSFGEALDTADAVYQNDRDGNINYRDYLRSVHQALLNRTAMESVREIVKASE